VFLVALPGYRAAPGGKLSGQLSSPACGPGRGQVAVVAGDAPGLAIDLLFKKNLANS